MQSIQFCGRNLLWTGFFLALALFLGGADGEGCGGKSVFEDLADDETEEAKIEKARIALDKGDYTTAVEALEDLCGTDLSAPACGPEIVGLYASGFAGRAGLDIFDLIKEAANQTAISGATSFALFSKHFASATVEDVNDMNAAVVLLESIPTRMPDQGLQLAVTATADLVVALGSLTGGYDPVTGKPNVLLQPTSAEDVNKVRAVLQRVLDDVDSMGTGLVEANIADENISGHIGQIQQDLSNADAVKVINFLNSI